VIDAHDAAAAAGGLAAVGIWIDCLEVGAARRSIQRCFSWAVLQTTYPTFVRRPWLPRAVGMATESRMLLVLLAVRAAAAALAVAGLATESGWAAAPAATVLAIGVLLHVRLVYGMDGADQMQSVVWAGLAIYAAAPDRTVGKAGLAFVAIQFVLSYLTSGLAKAVSEEWRNGSAIRGVLSTHSYGAEPLARRLGGPVGSLVAGWSVIAFEVGAPFLALAGGAALVAMLAGAVLFHASIAIVMGLNDFFWAFISPLPLVALAVTTIH
jgi:hypothetical protein